MGKTVESYRLALDSEIQSWNGFLNIKKDVTQQIKEMSEYLCDSLRFLRTNEYPRRSIRYRLPGLSLDFIP